MADEQTPEETIPFDAGAAGAGNDLDAVTAERDQFKDKWTRALADHENYRRRVQKDAEDERKYGAASLIRTVLPAIDNLVRAIEAAKKPEAQMNDLAQGVEMVHQQFEKILVGLGAQPIPAVGEPFDPNLHEALTQIPSASYPPMTVVQEIERGYKLHDRVIRPAKVIVSAADPTA